MPANQMGPAVVGRLRGAAYRLANKITITIPDDIRIDAAIRGKTLKGAEAICFGGMTGNDQLQPPVPSIKSGVRTILAALEEAYGQDASEQLAVTLERFFTLRRGAGSLMDYCTAFKLRYEAAEEQAGLAIGPVGLTHLFISGAGLANRYIDDVMLKVDHDRNKYKEITEIVGRTAKLHQSHPEEASRHLLYVNEYEDADGYAEEDDEFPNVAYFTDNIGQWYLWDYDHCAAYYLVMDTQESEYYKDEAYWHWDGIEDTSEYQRNDFTPVYFFGDDPDDEDDDDEDDEEEGYYDDNGVWYGRGRSRFRRRGYSRGYGGRNRSYGKGQFRRRRSNGGRFGRRRNFYGDEEQGVEDDVDYGDDGHDDDETNESYMGRRTRGGGRRRKGKGKGKGRRGKGKGKGSYKGKSKGKGKGFRKGSSAPHLASLAGNETKQDDASNEAYKAKGVSKGGTPACKKCESRFHKTEDCPGYKRDQASVPAKKAANLAMAPSIFDSPIKSHHQYLISTEDDVNPETQNPEDEENNSPRC